MVDQISAVLDIKLENATALVSKSELYIGGSILLCQVIEPVMFAHCAFIFALRNITLAGYLDTCRIYNIYGTTYDLYIYIAKIRAIEQTRKLASLTIKSK